MELSGDELSKGKKTAFELGIKLGTLFHQFIGTPVSKKSKSSLEKSIEESIKNQPFVKEVEVNIEVKSNDYITLGPKNLSAKVVIEYEEKIGVGKLKYTNGYPLMWVEEIKEKNNS